MSSGIVVYTGDMLAHTLSKVFIILFIYFLRGKGGFLRKENSAFFRLRFSQNFSTSSTEVKLR